MSEKFPEIFKNRIDVFYNKFSIRKVRIHDLHIRLGIPRAELNVT